MLKLSNSFLVVARLGLQIEWVSVDGMSEDYQSCLVSYKQCISTLESSADASSAELRLMCQKCNEAADCSRRIHSLIQLKYDDARAHGSQQSKIVPVTSSTTQLSDTVQAQPSSMPLATRSVSRLQNLCPYVLSIVVLWHLSEEWQRKRMEQLVLQKVNHWLIWHILSAQM